MTGPSHQVIQSIIDQLTSDHSDEDSEGTEVDGIIKDKRYAQILIFFIH